MESSRNYPGALGEFIGIIKGGQNGVKSQLAPKLLVDITDYKGGAKWSQVATLVPVR